jgi:microcystin-dependent protein
MRPIATLVAVAATFATVVVDPRPSNAVQICGCKNSRGRISKIQINDPMQPQDCGASRTLVCWDEQGASVPVGVVAPFSGDVAPAGWLLCDGSALSRTTHQALFDVIQTSFGAGDGNSTFNIPDLRGRMATGMGTHAKVDTLGDSDGLGVASRTPEHSHTVNSHRHIVDNHSHHVEIWSGGEAFSYWSASHRYPKANYDNFAHGHAVIGETWGAAPGTSWEAPGTDARAPGYLTMNYIIKY